jgi:FkbM family methyltransferase
MASLKSLLWHVIANTRAGASFRLTAPLLENRPTVFGLKNPMYMKHSATEQHGSLYVTEANNYIAVGSGRGYRVRYDPNHFEEEISYLMKHLVRREDIVLDIGANIGFHTVLMAKAASDGHVFAFEPIDEMAEQNSANCAINRLQNVTLVRCALGNENTELDMNVNVGGTGLQGTSSFIEHNSNVSAHPDQYVQRPIKVRRLDDIVGKLSLPGPISFIKIDTEGFDTQVLEGGIETINKHKPVMIVEAHTDRLAQAGKSWQWYLDEFPDYHIFISHSVTNAKPFLHLEPLTADQPRISVNLLMVPRGRQLTISDLED